MILRIGAYLVRVVTPGRVGPHARGVGVGVRVRVGVRVGVGVRVVSGRRRRSSSPVVVAVVVAPGSDGGGGGGWEENSRVARDGRADARNASRAITGER